MSGITDVDVTFGSVLGPRTFKRAAARTLNGGSGSNTSWLWLSKQTARDEIAEISLLYDDEAPPAGWEKVDKDITKGAVEGKPVYIAVRRKADGEDAPPLVDIAIQHEAEACSDGYNVLERSASREGAPLMVKLAVRHRQPGDVPEFPGDVLKVGDGCDVRYKGEWFKGHVTKVAKFHVCAKRDGFETYPEIELLRRSEDLAAFDTKTEGRDTRGVVKQGEAFEINAETLDAMEEQIDAIIRGKMTLKAAHNFAKQQLAPYLEKALSSFVAEEHQERVYEFTQATLRLCVYFLARPEPLHPSIRQQLVRIFLGDRRCSFFFNQKQHGIYGSAPEAKHYLGDTAKFPNSGASKYFIGNVNYFGKIGGYQVLARRFDSSTGFQVPIEELKGMVGSVIKVPFRVYTEQFAKDLFPRLYMAVLNRLLRMSTKELRANPREVAIKDVLQPMNTVYFAIKLTSAQGRGGFHGYGEVLPRPHIEIVEEWSTTMALRQLRAEPMGIRLEGMQNLVEIVQQTRRREGRLPTTESRWSARQYRNVQARLAVADYWTGPTLAKWIKEAGVVKALLGKAEDGDLSGVIRFRATPEEEGPDRPLRACVTLVDPEASQFMMGEEEAIRAAKEAKEAGKEGPSSGAGAGGAASGGDQQEIDLTVDEPQAFAVGGKPGYFLSTHANLATHVPEVLLMLAEEKELGGNEVEMLWAANPGSNDEDLRKAIFEAVRRVSAKLPKRLQSHLFRKVASTPADQLDQVTIDLIKQFTVATHCPPEPPAPKASDERPAPADPGAAAGGAQGVNASGNDAAEPAADAKGEDAEEKEEEEEVDEATKTSGLNLLYEVSLVNPQGLPDQSVPEAARKALVDLLMEAPGCEAGGNLEARSVEYMGRAVRGIKEGKSVRECVQLAQAVLQALSDRDVRLANDATAKATGVAGAGESKDNEDDVEEIDEEVGGGANPAAGAGPASEGKEGEKKETSPKVERMTADKMIQLLQEKEELLNVIIGEVLRYKEHAAKRADSLGITPAYLVTQAGVGAASGAGTEGGEEEEDDDDDDPVAQEARAAKERRDNAVTEKKVSGTRQPHSSEIESRLKFLSFVLTKSSSTSLDIVTFDKLWQGLAVHFLTPGERSAFFGWLKKTQFESVGSAGALLSEEEAKEVFEKRLCSDEAMGFQRLTLDVFRCFESFFTFINGKAGKLSSSDPMDDQVGTRDVELTGIDALWSILAQVKSKEVRNAVQERIVGTYLRIDTSTGLTKQKAWESFVAKVMGKAKALLADVKARGVKATQFTTLRELSVLAATLRAFSDQVETTGRKAQDDKYNILIEVHVTDENDPRETKGRCVRTLYYEMNKYATLGELRERIARRLGFPASHIYMENYRHQYYNSWENEGNEVHDFWAHKGIYTMACHDAKFRSQGHDDEPHRFAPDLMQNDEEACTRMYPMMLIMNNDEYFSTVRELLELPFEPADEQYDIFQTIWDLTQAVPARYGTRKAVCSLQGAVASPIRLPAAVLEEEDASALVKKYGFAEEGEEEQPGAPNWDDLLPLDSPGTLLYNLTLLQRVAMPVRPWWETDEKGKEKREKHREDKMKRMEKEQEEAKKKAEEAAAAAAADPASEDGKKEEGEEEATAPVDIVGRPLTKDEEREEGNRKGKQTVELPIAKQLELEQQEADQRKAWMEAFVAKGGIKHLARGVLGGGINLQKMYACPAGKAAMVAALKLLNFFLLGTAAKLDGLESEKVLAPAGAASGAGASAGGAAADAAAAPQLCMYDADVETASMVARAVELIGEAAKAATESRKKQERLEAAAAAAKDDDDEEGGNKKQDAQGNMQKPSENAMKQRTDPEEEAKGVAGSLAVESQAVSECSKLLRSTVTADPASLKALYDTPSAQESIVQSLLATRERAVRAEVQRVLSSMAVQLQDPSKMPEGLPRPNEFFAKALAESIDEVYGNPDGCLEFFRVLGTCLRADTEVPAKEKDASEGGKKEEKEGEKKEGQDEPKKVPPPPPSVIDTAPPRQPKEGIPELMFDAGALADKLVGYIREHPIVEVSAEDFDLVLRGFLRTLHALVERVPSLAAKLGVSGDGGRSIVDFVYEEGLFHQEEHEKVGADPSKAPEPEDEKQVKLPLCKSKHTREAAMRFLSAVADRHEPTAAHLCALVSMHHSPEAAALAKPAPKKQGRSMYYRFEDMAKSSTGYVGLVNQGCTCYMNASMQQLFMMPKFRQGILAAVDKTKEHPEKRQEDFMWQCKLIFAHLQESSKKAYDTAQYCKSFKDWDGNPVNPVEQRDASEYLGELIQKIESEVSGTKSEAFLKDTLEGMTAREQVAEGGKYYRVVKEPFYFLQVRCEGVSTLDQALQRYCRGEMMSNKKWTDDDDKLIGNFDTMMRPSLRNLPPHLFISLSRYKTDWARGGATVKINSYLEFPERINFFKYTMQGRPDAVVGRGETHRVQTPEEYDAMDPSKIAETCNEFADPCGPEEYEYELVGMVVHTGGANSGHYFSYIQERGPEGGTGRWMEFNDAYVSTWDPKRMKEDCFGGEEEYRGRGFYENVNVNGQYVRRYREGEVYRRTRYQNAFLVVYDKVPAERYLREQKAKRGAAAAAAAVAAASGAGDASEGEKDTSQLSLVERFKLQVEKKQQQQSSSLQMSRAKVPPELLGNIASDNRSFWRKRNVLNAEYFDFMKGLLGAAMRKSGEQTQAASGAADPSTSMVPYPAGGVKDSADARKQGGGEVAALQTSLAFVMFTLADPQSPQRHSAPQWLTMLKKVAGGNKVAAVWLLQTLLSDRTLLRQMLMRHNDVRTREAFSELVHGAIELIVDDETFDDEVDVPPALKRRSSSVGAEDEAASGKPSSGAAVDADLKTADGPAVQAEGLDGGLSFAAPPGRVVSSLLKVMLEEACKSQSDSFTYSDFFQVLWKTAQASKAASAFLIRQGAVGMLVDLVCEGRTPHPELVDGPGGWAPTESIDDGPNAAGGAAGGAAAGGSGAGASASSDGKKPRPVFAGKPRYFAMPPLVVVQQLVSRSAGVFDKVSDAPALSRVDKEQLTCPSFRQVLRECMTTEALVDKLEGLMGELIGTEAAMQDFTRGALKDIGKAVSPNAGTTIMAMRVVLQPLAGEPVEAAAARVEEVMPPLMETIKKGSNYFAETVDSFYALMKIVKTCPLVGAWAVKHAEEFAWMTKWASKNQRPPYYNTPGAAMQLSRNARLYSDQANRVYSGMSHDIKLLAAGIVGHKGADGAVDGHSVYNPSMPEAVVNRRARMMVGAQFTKWVRATITEYDAVQRRHTVEFDDDELPRLQNGELIEVVKLPLLTWQLLPDTEASKMKVQGEDPPVPFDEEGLKKTIREADEERRKKAAQLEKERAARAASQQQVAGRNRRAGIGGMTNYGTGTGGGMNYSTNPILMGQIDMGDDDDDYDTYGTEV